MLTVLGDRKGLGGMRPLPRHVLHAIGRSIDELEVFAPSLPDRRASYRAGLFSIPLLLRGGSATADADVSGYESVQDSSGGAEPDGSASVVQSTLPEVEDDRLFSPESSTDTSPMRRLSSKPVRRLVAASPTAMPKLSDAVYLPHSDSVITCIRRKARRRAVLALGHGGGGHKPPTRNDKSNIRC